MYTAYHMSTISELYTKKNTILPKQFSRRFAVKSIAIGSFIFAIFTVGFLIGGGMSTKATASDNIVATPLFRTVQENLESQLVYWKSSSTLPTAKELEYGMITGYVNSYKDPYTVFFPPKEAKSFAENVKGSFAGVGMNVGMKDGNIVVIAPLKDSPAMKAGIKAGDIITAVDGQNMIGQSSDEAVSLIRGELDNSQLPKEHTQLIHELQKRIHKSLGYTD